MQVSFQPANLADRLRSCTWCSAAPMPGPTGRPIRSTGRSRAFIASWSASAACSGRATRGRVVRLAAQPPPATGARTRSFVGTAAAIALILIPFAAHAQYVPSQGPQGTTGFVIRPIPGEVSPLPTSAPAPASAPGRVPGLPGLLGQLPAGAPAQPVSAPAAAAPTSAPVPAPDATPALPPPPLPNMPATAASLVAPQGAPGSPFTPSDSAAGRTGNSC